MKSETVAVIVLGGLVLFGKKKKREPAPGPSRGDSPFAYGEEKLPILKARAAGELGTVLSEYLPQVWPSVPIESVLGFTSIATGQREDTVTATNTQKGHEVGYFQTPAGLREYVGLDAPDPDPEHDWSHWAREADSEIVAKLLGRKASLVPNAWKESVRDQVAVGLADLDHERRATAALIAPLTVTPSTTWGVALAFMGFSAGADLAARWVNRYKADLVNVPEEKRWSALGDAIAADIAAGGATSWVHGRHKNPAASYLRTWQKLEAGNALAKALGKGPQYATWYDAPRVDPVPLMRAGW